MLNNKKADNLLGAIKDFIYKNGKPNILHSDNGKEFHNKLMEEYCNNNEIKIKRGRPYHPQSQGIVESFNKEIKRLLENKYLEAPKKFSIIMALPDIIEIYNNNIHSSTKLKPLIAFNLKNEKEIKNVIDNIKKIIENIKTIM